MSYGIRQQNRLGLLAFFYAFHHKIIKILRIAQNQVKSKRQRQILLDKVNLL